MFYLKRNLPLWERALRLGAGAMLAVAMFLWAPSLLVAVLGWGTAVVLGGTALAGFCPACALVGRRPLKGGA